MLSFSHIQVFKQPNVMLVSLMSVLELHEYTDPVYYGMWLHFRLRCRRSRVFLCPMWQVVDTCVSSVRQLLCNHTCRLYCYFTEGEKRRKKKLEDVGAETIPHRDTAAAFQTSPRGEVMQMWAQSLVSAITVGRTTSERMKRLSSTTV